MSVKNKMDLFLLQAPIDIAIPHTHRHCHLRKCSIQKVCVP